MRYLIVLIALGSLFFVGACGEDSTGGGATGDSESSVCDSVTCSGNGECVVTDDDEAACLCDEGYESAGVDCVAPDPCEGVDCSGNGECAVTESGEAACLCDEGYESAGVDCVAPDPCEGVDCSGNGECAVTESGEAACLCDEGYESAGVDCVAPDPCEGVDCSGNGECVADSGQPVCACDRGYSAEETACVPGFDYVFEGTFTVASATTSTGAFSAIEGADLEFFVGFDVTAEQTGDLGGIDEPAREYLTDSVTFWLGGEGLSADAQAVVDTIVADLNGQGHFVSAASELGTRDMVRFGNLTGEEADEYFGLEISSIDIELPDGSDGYPEIATFEDESAFVMLRRYSNTNGFEMTDFTSSNGIVSLW